MFSLYESTADGKDCVLVPGNVHIAGVLRDTLRDMAQSVKPKTTGEMPWEITGSELCEKVAAKYDLRKSAISYKLVVDATYSRKDAVLFEIRHVWAFSYPSWTPLLLRLSVLAGVENRPNGPST